MEEMSKHLRCPRCGKKMKKIASQKEMFPMGLMVSSIPDTEYLATLRHFQCPEKHVGIILIPVMEFNQRKLDMMKARRYRGWD